MQGSIQPQSGPVATPTRLLAAATLLAIPIALLFLCAEHPARRGFLPPCPTLWLGRFYCPGCGALRTIHFALNGDFAAAWAHNPLLLLIGPPLALVLAVSLLSVALRGRWLWPLTNWPHTRTATAWTLTALVIIFGIARNLPGSTWDRLRPPSPPISPAPQPPPSPASL